MPSIVRTVQSFTLAAAALVFVAAAPRLVPATLPGVRFTVDTAETKAPATGIFSMFTGRIEVVAGRGRIDVASVAAKPPRSVNDITVGPPLAGAHDYYLFDSTGYILVRPSSRTFSSVSFTTSTYRYGNVREAWDGFFEFGQVRRTPIAANDIGRSMQHGAFTIRWHLDRANGVQPMDILARGRTIVADAPRGEASIVRWMGVAVALATLRDSISPLDADLQLTTVVVLPPESSTSGPTNLDSAAPDVRRLDSRHRRGTSRVTRRIYGDRLARLRACTEPDWPVGRRRQTLASAAGRGRRIAQPASAPLVDHTSV